MGAENGWWHAVKAEPAEIVVQRLPAGYRWEPGPAEVPGSTRRLVFDSGGDPLPGQRVDPRLDAPIRSLFDY